MAMKSDLAHIGRLKEEEEKALHETTEKIQQWKKFDQDYTALQNRVSTLPDKVSHHIMVPFGKLAFMPGQLVHTNEILVLLGDNWFAERSAKQACDTINRRKGFISKMVDDLKKQQYLLESRLGFVSDMKKTVDGMGDVVEIREEYNEAQEAKWKEERKLYNRKASAATSSSGKPPSSSHGNEENETRELTEEQLLWARLDELERQEEELDELELSDEEHDEEKLRSERYSAMGLGSASQNAPSSAGVPHNQRHVHWDDESKVAASDLTLDLRGDEEKADEEEEDDDDDEAKTASVIHFSHTRVPSEVHPLREDSKDLSPRSPGDIYELYQSKNGDGADHPTPEGQPISILKQPTRKSLPDQPPVSIPEIDVKRQPLPAPISAFTGSVVEHSQSEITNQTSEMPQEQGQGSKRVSKFKAARQGKR